jgi:hypothetical protein
MQVFFMFDLYGANRGADPRASQETTLRLREAQSGQVPCSGARRQNKVLDEVSAAIHGGVAAENVALQRARLFAIRCKSMVRAQLICAITRYPLRDKHPQCCFGNSKGMLHR